MIFKEKVNELIEYLKGTVEVDCWWYYMLLTVFLLELVIGAVKFIVS